MYYPLKKQNVQSADCILYIKISSFWAEFVNKKDASVYVQYPRRIKAFNFDNSDNSHNSFL